MKNNFAAILLLVLLIIVSSAFAYYYGTQKGKSNNSPIPQTNVITDQPTPTSSPIPSPTIAPTQNIPSGWETYTNEKFGFEISYPSSYKALTDKNNLYGWPKGIVLIYKGGQSYDLVIEYWNSPSEYENKYKNQPNVTVKKVNDFYITLLNNNLDPEIDKVIETFNLITP